MTAMSRPLSMSVTLSLTLSLLVLLWGSSLAPGLVGVLATTSTSTISSTSTIDIDVSPQTGGSGDANRPSFTHSLVRHMWQTPIQQFSLLNRNIMQTDLDHLSTEITTYYRQFRTSVIASTANTASSATATDEATISDLFYRHQQQADLQYKQCMLSSKLSETKMHCTNKRPVLFQDLARLFIWTAQSMAEEHGIKLFDPQQPSQQHCLDDPQLCVFAWTSLHANGSYHTPHHHVDSVLSGVFYVQIPENEGRSMRNGAGDLVFYDPRGALPPFGKSLHITPKPGELVLFPGYLLHSVEPTHSASAFRISVSFNIQGSWEAASDVNSAYFT
jgi:uncharacterized protein (TIGR02466 family)